jgi:hypothetical protein
VVDRLVRAPILYGLALARRIAYKVGRVFLRIFSPKTEDGEMKRYLAFAHNECDSRDVPVTNVFHNFGRKDSLTRRALARLIVPGSGYRLQGCR